MRQGGEISVGTNERVGNGKQKVERGGEEREGVHAKSEREDFRGFERKRFRGRLVAVVVVKS